LSASLSQFIAKDSQAPTQHNPFSHEGLTRHGKPTNLLRKMSLSDNLANLDLEIESMDVEENTAELYSENQAQAEEQHDNTGNHLAAEGEEDEISETDRFVNLLLETYPDVCSRRFVESMVDSLLNVRVTPQHPALRRLKKAGDNMQKMQIDCQKLEQQYERAFLEMQKVNVKSLPFEKFGGLDRTLKNVHKDFMSLQKAREGYYEACFTHLFWKHKILEDRRREASEFENQYF